MPFTANVKVVTNARRIQTAFLNTKLVPAAVSALEDICSWSNLEQPFFFLNRPEQLRHGFESTTLAKMNFPYSLYL